MIETHRRRLAAGFLSTRICQFFNSLLPPLPPVKTEIEFRQLMNRRQQR
jgi:hypothetical protein